MKNKNAIEKFQLQELTKEEQRRIVGGGNNSTLYGYLIEKNNFDQFEASRNSIQGVGSAAIDLLKN